GTSWSLPVQVAARSPPRLVRLFFCCFFFASFAPHPVRHSFPTRRSSDLIRNRSCRTIASNERSPAHSFSTPSLASNVSPDWSTRDRKSTRLNSSHGSISYAVFSLKKKKKSIRHHDQAPRSMPACQPSSPT